MTRSKLFSMVPPMALGLIRQGFAALAGLVLLAGVKGVSAEEAAPPTYAIAMHGAPWHGWRCGLTGSG